MVSKKFSIISKTNRTILYLDNELNTNIKNFNLSPFDYLLNVDGECYREVKSRSTLRINLFNKVYYIKKYYPIKFMELVKNIISLKLPFDNAINERNAIFAVKQQNINTLDIAGYGWKRKLLADTSFLLTRAIEPNLSLDKLLELYLNNKNYFKLKRLLIQFLAKTTNKLHANGLNHRDYYICHYLLKTNDNISAELSQTVINDNLLNNILNNIYLIDLHRMQIRNKIPKRYLIKDLSALLFSVRNYQLTKTDYLRFIKYYNYDLIKQHKTLNNITTKASKIWEKG